MSERWRRPDFGSRPVEVEDLGASVGFEERSLLEMEAKRAKARAGGVSFTVSVVDTDLDPFADYRDPEDRPKLTVFGDAEAYMSVRVITTRGHDVTMSGDSTPTFENLDLRDGDRVFVLGSFRGRPMEAVDGWSRTVRTQDNGVRYLSGEELILKLQKTESWKRALHGRHWAVERPTYWKPWSSRNLSLCADSRPNRRWPDLWSEGNHPRARREYFILSQGPWTVLARDPYNCRCEFLGTSDLDDSIRWRLNFVIQDEGDFSHYTDRVNVTDLITGDTFEWRGWSSGTSPSQPFVPCL